MMVTLMVDPKILLTQQTCLPDLLRNSNTMSHLDSVDDNSETDNEDDLDLTNDDDQDDDGRDGLSEEEVLELEASLTPVRLMLTKVSEFQTVD
jgi:hypothetical protein